MRRDEVADDLRELVFDFFFRFLRFESALKERGYLQWTSPGDRAVPSWRKFAAEHRETYQPNSAAFTLIEAKPKIQVIAQNGGLDFQDEHIPENVAILDRVIAHAHTVRNNLFHGGKHGSGDWDDPARMTVLLESTIGVLDDLAERGGFGGDYTGYY